MNNIFKGIIVLAIALLIGISNIDYTQAEEISYKSTFNKFNYSLNINKFDSIKSVVTEINRESCEEKCSVSSSNAINSYSLSKNTMENSMTIAYVIPYFIDFLVYIILIGMMIILINKLKKISINNKSVEK